MTMTALSARDQRTLFVGAGIILTLILVSRGLPAWVRWTRRVREDAAAAQAEAMASQRAVSAAPALARLTQQVERRYFALAPALFTGVDRAAAGAALISTVNAAARTAGVQLGALQIETDTTNDSGAAGGMATLRVRGDGAGDVAGVTRFLSTIEGNVPLLSVRELTVTPVDPHLTSDKPETLRLAFLIEGVAGSGPDEDDHPGNVQDDVRETH